MAQKIEEKKRIALSYEESQEWFTRKKKIAWSQVNSLDTKRPANRGYLNKPVDRSFN